MTNTTLAGAAETLYDVLTADTATGTPATALAAAGVVRVYENEPGAGGVAKPCSVTIQFTRWEPTDWVFTVRVYVADLPTVAAQDRVIAVVAALDSVLAGAGCYGPSRGEVGWIDEIGVWVAATEITVGREDGF